jgi:hypothetical protein
MTPRRRRMTFAIFAVSSLALTPIAFYSKLPLVFYRHDGTYLLTLAAMQKTWAITGWNVTSNPLQGIGGLALPQHALLDPSLWLTTQLSAATGPVVAMTLYAAALAFAICWLGMRLGLGALPSIAAAWIGLLLAFPYVYPSLGLDFLWTVPSYIPLIVLDIAAFLLLLDLGRGPPVGDATRALGIGAILAYEFVQYPNFVPVSVVMLSFFGVVATVAAESMRERIVKLVCGMVLTGLALIVFGRFLYGLWGFSKATFFWYEFWPRATGLRDQSFMIADYSRWPAWLVYGLSLVGALHAAFRATPPTRTVARGFLLLGVGILILVLATSQDGWKGPRVAYIDIFLFPFYCIFAVHGAMAAALSLPKVPITNFRHRDMIVSLIVCAVPWLVLLDYAPPPLERPLVRNVNPYIWPPAETPVSKFLAAKLALRPGSPFRGRVASVAGADFDPQWISAPFVNQHIYDGMSLFFSGNDHRMYGLWYYNIPTLLEGNQFSSPFFHLVNARLLNAPGSIDMRSWETQSIVNDRIMALLGVRYLLSDKPLPERTPVLSYRLVEGRDLYIYSVPDTNMAGYAVTKVRRAESGKDVIALLADPAFDPRTTAALTAPEELPPLVPASVSGLTIERGGYQIEADSPGTSLLVLPIEYSHCLHAKLVTSAGRPPRLLRINLVMAGILFGGRIEGHLTLRYGPFSSECRIEDWREAQALKIGEAREWPRLK